jgi:hypothetical protein
MSKSLLTLIFIVILPVLFAKNLGDIMPAQKLPVDTLTHKQKLVRKSILLGSMGVYTAASLTFLDLLWYRPYQTTNFHFFNDNAQWCQMDKFGHAFSAYSSARLVMQTMNWAGFETSPFHAGLGQLSSGGLRWAGFSEKQSIIIGQTFGLLYLSSVEIMDGFSKEWGFSWGDEAANFVGGFAFSLQQYYWGEQRIQLKFSTHGTDFPKYRPNVLGSNWVEQIIKDYNGQTYWIAFNISSFLKKGNKFPNWLNLAFGYGATNMISGKNNLIVYPDGNTAVDPVSNQTEIIDKNGQINYFNRYRKYYVSLDIDFTKIKTRSRLLKSIFSVINSFKIPFPTMEFDRYGSHFKPFYF